MKNLLPLILVCLFPIFGNAQETNKADRWYSTAELELMIPTKARYDYSIDNIGSDVEINSKIALGAQYTLNYLLFKKFSVGALAGYEQQFKPDFSMLRLGGIIKFFFVDPDNVYIYLQEAGNISLDKSNFKSGNNIRIGLGFPILKRESFNINTNVFLEQNYLDLKGADALLFETEEPADIYLNSIGISLGVQF
ncbi:hypothetical protein JM83_1337 [Gillisia sp. Hel_I_86]|uniref:hypothetical protein n=1 Tax=Gillisia sp. Hel_I_86 TaxID=1249981 RepID=UPI00119A78B8|nr:hypothetical protein [Gillisia sp. Hel_I_86]TVZ26380.1 hypothetical protein JM83_1337 [Gillisia sp. Hel_I_86]